ncbi:MAG: stationary phase survival protein SurE [Dehalococcoidales bacterium]|nr:stationary phase survival protein SurE [Dehalococcoidales bacterium]
MKILVTNDDGILADGLWILARELNKVAPVVVIAPDREQSAIGTAVTLTHPLRVQKVRPLLPGVEAYSVEGTPGDSVILALEKLAKNEIGLVVSGINQGLNLGNDVLISGTVGAALQGYLRGLPAIAISIAPKDSLYLDGAARVAALLASRIVANALPEPIFLNVNLPDLPLAETKGIRLTSLASESHLDTVEEGHDGKRQYYWLVRRRIPDRIHQEMTDIWAVEKGHISITPLHIYGDHNCAPAVTDSFCTDSFCADLFQELQKDALKKKES